MARSSARPRSPPRPGPAWTPSTRPSRARRTAAAAPGRRCRPAADRASRRCGCRPDGARPRPAPTPARARAAPRPRCAGRGRSGTRAVAPATTASTTSLTVPPNAFLTSLKSSSRLPMPMNRRCGPMWTFSGVSGAGFRPAQTISPTPSAASRVRASARSGCASASRAPSASSIPARTAPLRPAATNSGVPGSRCGRHARPECLIGGGSGLRSNSTVARSIPAMPSISE